MVTHPDITHPKLTYLVVAYFEVAYMEVSMYDKLSNTSPCMSYSWKERKSYAFKFSISGGSLSGGSVSEGSIPGGIAVWETFKYVHTSLFIATNQSA